MNEKLFLKHMKIIHFILIPIQEGLPQIQKNILNWPNTIIYWKTLLRYMKEDIIILLIYYHKLEG